MSEQNVKEIVKTAYKALDDKKAEDIRILYIADISVMADYFIICNGNNKQQILTMQDNVIEQLEKIGVEPKNIEGKNADTWILMDYRDVIIHIFDTENRNFYNLERLWRDGKEIDINNI